MCHHTYRCFIVVCFLVCLQCETLIEEHEEILIETFQETEESVENSLCVDVLG